LAGIYIHIPFCRQACTYCNFHFSTLAGQKTAVLEAIKQEISLTPLMVEDELIATIYLGGGTPSLLLPEEISSIFESLQEKFTISPAAEITLEANPDDISTAILQQWKAMNINRISLGVQSFNEAELKWMNRAHNAKQSIESINNIIAAGFTNFSVDLIYGSPLLSNADFVTNVETVLNKNVPHVSAYALTVEPKTALNSLIIKHKSAPVDELRQAEQFDILVQMMEDAGYEQYEISNFAKSGFRSKHNSSYWQGKPYYGFGPSAHSFDGHRKRRWNIANNALYQKSIENKQLPFEEEILTPTQQLNEYIMISLRTMEGIDLEIVAKKFGRENMETMNRVADTFVSQQLLDRHDQHLVLSKKGKFLADGIAADLFF
jgi:oxygen-independent coproporphyrinogen-3 oxidase